MKATTEEVVTNKGLQFFLYFPDFQAWPAIPHAFVGKDVDGSLIVQVLDYARYPCLGIGICMVQYYQAPFADVLLHLLKGLHLRVPLYLLPL